MNGQFFCETSDECVPCSGVVELRAENAALAKLVDEALQTRAIFAPVMLAIDWIHRAEALRAGQQKEC